MGMPAKTVIGLPCKHGHGDLRMAAGGGCAVCVKLAAKKAWASRGEHWRAHRRAKYATDGGREDRRARNLKRNYGLSIKQYEWMETMQRNRCGICDREEPKGRLHVDHCHKTGKTRKLLCTGCNLGLGAFRENPKALRAALAYLKDHGV